MRIFRLSVSNSGHERYAREKRSRVYRRDRNIRRVFPPLFRKFSTFFLFHGAASAPRKNEGDAISDRARKQRDSLTISTRVKTIRVARAARHTSRLGRSVSPRLRPFVFYNYGSFMSFRLAAGSARTCANL